MKFNRFSVVFGRKFRAGTSVATFLILTFSFSFNENVFAAPAVSAQMIEQLKRLPRAEQEALARQYGVDTAILEGTGSVAEAISETGIGTSRGFLEPVKTVIVTEATQSEKGKLARYGAHVFDKDVSTFAPVNDNLPVPEDYLMGPGDTLNIFLYGKEHAPQQVLKIDREGTINFPRLGAISLTGLSFQETKKIIEQRVTQQMIGTEVIVSMGRLGRIGVFMAGEVRTPGSYSVSALSTLTQVLYVAGGISNVGSLRHIQVRRGGSVINTFDVYDLMLKGKVDGDIRLQSGDVVFVPTVGPLITIEGAILRPGEYELRGTEDLREAIEMAGGVLGRGYIRIVRLERYSPGDALPQLMNLDLSNEGQMKTTLQDGDSIVVDLVSDRNSNPVKFVGALSRPGKYAWFEGARFSDYVSNAEADLLEDTDLSVGLIARRRNDELDIELNSFNVLSAMKKPGSSEDPLIQPHDEVLLFSIPKTDQAQSDSSTVTAAISDRSRLLMPILEKLRTQESLDEDINIVGIGGAVREPGEYPLLEGGTVGSLIELAGGLTGNAFTENVEIRRISSITGDSARIQLINKPIKGFNGEGDSFELRSRDFVRVNYVRNWNPVAMIKIQGEATFPGEYLIAPGETLKSILDRAGGLTENSFPEGAVFSRMSVRELQKKQLASLSESIVRSQVAQLITAESKNATLPLIAGIGAHEGGPSGLTEALMSIETEGRLIIDLPGIISGTPDTDIAVRDGDIFTVPARTDSVTVVGEVRRPGSFRYDSSLNYMDYIELAAGTTARSDNRSIYVVKANGKVEWLRRGSSKLTGRRWLGTESSGRPIQEGDTVVVPIDEKYQKPLNRYREITTVLFQGIVSIATLLAL